MATPKVKSTITMKLEGRCPTHARTDILVRDTETTIDEPEVRGGTNLGPSPTETMIGALAGCTNVIAHKVGHMHGVEFTAFHVAITCSFDRRGVLLEEEVDVPFDDIVIAIEATTDADDAALDKVKKDLPRFCPVSKVMSQSGSKVSEVWTINRP
jgi:putative redox protein